MRSGGGLSDSYKWVDALIENNIRHKLIFIIPDDSNYRTNRSTNVTFIEYKVAWANNIKRLYYDNVSLKKILKINSADVLFTMGNNGPIMLKKYLHVAMIRRPQLVYPFRMLAYFSLTAKLKYLFLRNYIQASLSSVDLLFFQTATMQSLFKSLYNYKGRSIIVGKVVSSSSKALLEPGTMNTKSNMFTLLYLTSYYQHKNIEKLCEVVIKLHANGLPIKLVLSLGNKTKRERLLLNRISTHNEVIQNIGYVPSDKISTVYSECDAVIQPSLFESFSSNYIEAMEYSKPLIVSDRAFSKEICGNAALYFDPSSEASMMNQITLLYQQPDIRKDLVRNGHDRLSKLDNSWNKLAENVLFQIEQLSSS